MTADRKAANWPHDGKLDEERIQERLVRQLADLEAAADVDRRRRDAVSEAIKLREAIKRLGGRPVA